MPVWIVELFGGVQINRAFLIMNALVMPFWMVMILRPRDRWAYRLSNPFLVPAVFGLVYVYALYLLVTVTGVPPLAGIEVGALRKFINHPLIFLVIWAHYLAVDLFLGMVLYRDATRRNMRVPGELILCWIFGPLGLVVYVARLLVRMLMLR